MLAALLTPSAMPGRITQEKESKPDAGSHFNFTQKSSISSSPHQNDGIDMPIMEMLITILSIIEYCLIADTMPNVSPNTTAKTTAKLASLTVLGKVCAMRVATFWRVE